MVKAVCVDVVTTIVRAGLRSPYGLAVCSDGKSGKQQLVVAALRSDRLVSVDLQTRTSTRNLLVVSVYF